MAEADLGKIVGMIMENPELVEKIKGLAEKIESEVRENTPAVTEETPVPVSNFSPKGSHRAELLHALGGFLSGERQKALESMSGVLGILDTMKTK